MHNCRVFNRMWIAAAIMSSGFLTLSCIPNEPTGIEPPPLGPPEPSRFVTIDTTMGRIVIELFPTQSPATVANFLSYVEERFYEQSIFHEVVAGDWIIAGAYTTNLEPKETDDPVTNESNNGLTHRRGYVALYEPDGPGTGTSAFLINLSANPELDYDPSTGERGMTVFGKVVSGYGVIDEIGDLETTTREAADGTNLTNVPTENEGIVQAFDSTELDEPQDGPNQAPVADAGVDQTVRPGDTVTLDGSASSDSNPADVLTYRWEQTSGPDVTLSDATSPTPTFTAGDISTLAFRLTVNDPFGLSDTATTTVTVASDANRPPTADAGENQTVLVGETVQLTGLGDDPDGDAINYAWAQTGGETVTLNGADTATPSFTAPSTGGTTLIFLLTVTDAQRGVATDTVSVAINTPPTADGGEARTVAGRVDVTLDGTGSSDSDAGDRLTYAWEHLSGPDVTIDNPTAARPVVTMPDTDGVVEMLLTVDDGRGGTAGATVNLTVIRDPDVRIETTLGEVVIGLLVEGAPGTTLNFLQYVEDGFYTGTIFHRVMPEFVIQGGGFLPDLSQAEPVRDPIENEFSEDRSNVQWTVAMAKVSGDADSATSQFFFSLEDNSENLDNQNGGFTVFAEVIEGTDVLLEMAEVETETATSPDGGVLEFVPVEPIVVEAMTLE